MPNDQARTMRSKSWLNSPLKGVKALGVMGLGTFSGITFLLGSWIWKCVCPAEGNASTTDLDAATFMQTSRPILARGGTPKRAAPHLRPALPMCRDRAGNL